MNCTQQLQRVKYLRNIYYSDEQGEIQCTPVTKLQSNVVASGTLYRVRGYRHLRGVAAIPSRGGGRGNTIPSLSAPSPSP